MLIASPQMEPRCEENRVIATDVVLNIDSKPRKLQKHVATQVPVSSDLGSADALLDAVADGQQCCLGGGHQCCGP